MNLRFILFLSFCVFAAFLTKGQAVHELYEDTASVEICDTDTLYIKTFQGYTNYQWYDGASPLAGETKYFLKIGNPLLFANRRVCFDTAVASNVCYEISSLYYNWSGKPDHIANLGADTTLCGGDSLVLQNDSNYASVTKYRWFPTNDSSQTLTVDSSGTYALILQSQDAFGVDCFSRDTIDVLFEDVPEINMASDTAFCEDETAQINNVINASLPVIYEWSPSAGLSEDSIAEPSVTMKGSQTYQLKVTNNTASGCADSSSISVFVQDFEAKLGSDQSSCAGDSIVLANDSNYASVDNIFWMPTSEITPQITVKTTGNYILRLSSNHTTKTCYSRDTVFINFETYPSISMSTDTLVCNGVGALINNVVTNTEMVSYSWTPSAGLNNDTIQKPTANVTGSQNYQLVVTNSTAAACSDTASITVNEASAINVNLGYVDTVICATTTIKLLANVSGGSPYGTPGSEYLYYWKPDSSASVLKPTNFVLQPNIQTYVPRNLYLEVTDSLGCVETSDTVSIRLTDLQLSVDKPSAQICKDDSVAFCMSASGGEGTLTYSWTPTAELTDPNSACTKSFSTISSRTYYGRVTDSTGCYLLDSVKIRAVNLPTVDFVQTQDTACHGYPYELDATPSGGTGGGYTLDWNLLTAPFGDSLELTSDSSVAILTKSTTAAAAQVIVHVTDSLGCESEIDASIKIYGVPGPSSDITYTPDVIFTEEPITFEANGENYTTLNWFEKIDDTTNNILGSNDSYSTEFIDSGQFIMYLELFNSSHCSHLDSIIYEVNLKQMPIVHNVFTPNGDNFNEYLAIDHLEFVTNTELVVYNRWGNVVYKANDYISDEENGWDGSDLPDGTYYYHFKYTDPSNNDEVTLLKGEILILR